MTKLKEAVDHLRQAAEAIENTVLWLNQCSIRPGDGVEGQARRILGEVLTTIDTAACHLEMTRRRLGPMKPRRPRVHVG